MPAPKGNQFWKARTSHGRDKLFTDPEVLWAACVEYFEWNEANPLKEAKDFHFQGKVIEHEVSKMRAMTIMGLCQFLEIDQSTWRDYRDQEGFSPVCTRAEEVIRRQKFEGASADLLNQSIIARDLGLAEKSQIMGKDDGPIEIKTDYLHEMSAFLERLAKPSD